MNALTLPARVKSTLACLVRRLRRNWLPCWIEDEHGEVFKAKYIKVGERFIVRTHVGRMVQGFNDSSTSRGQIAYWWPDLPPNAGGERTACPKGTNEQE